MYMYLQHDVGTIGVGLVKHVALCQVGVIQCSVSIQSLSLTLWMWEILRHMSGLGRTEETEFRRVLIAVFITTLR